MTEDRVTQLAAGRSRRSFRALSGGRMDWMLKPEGAEARVPTDAPSMRARWLAKLLGILNGPRLRFVLPDGETVDPADGPPVAEARIRNTRTLAKLLIDPTFEFAEGYRLGNIEVDGDLSQLIEEI